MLSVLAEFESAIQAPAMDGIFGPITARAVREYQRLVGLEPNGRVDERTWNSIYDSFARADYFLRRDTLRAQALGAENFDRSARLGQYPGAELTAGQRDEKEGAR